MSEPTYTQYWAEINDLADNLIRETFEWQNDDLSFEDRVEATRDEIYDVGLHELVDSHQWVIYYAYNLGVIDHSDNPDYMVDNFGAETAGNILKDKGNVKDLHTAIAYWCMYADISDKLSAIWDSVIADLADEHEVAEWD